MKPGTRGTPRTRRQQGQVLAIFAAATILFVGILAIVIDVSWYWANSLRVQRAADAAALAGVVWLPGNVASGVAAADAAVAQNGITVGGSTTVTVSQDSQVVTGGNPNQLDVTVSAPINTFFMRLFGINSIQASRSSKAVYILPVPMGSPQNYYGDFGSIRYATPETVTTVTPATVGPTLPTTFVSGGSWTSPANMYSGSVVYTTDTVQNHAEVWKTFTGLTVPSGATVTGIQLIMSAKATTATTCTVTAALSWNGTSWSTAEVTTALTSTVTSYGLGGTTDTWGHTWAVADIAALQLKLTDTGCSGSHTTSVRQAQLTVSYTTSSTTTLPNYNLTDPNLGVLTPQGFWGTIMSQGGEDINGDIYAPKYDDNGSSKTSNPNYNSTNYYNYDVQMPAGSSGGQLWIFDAPFCASDTGGQYGTGDRWFNGNTTGISTFYDLYDTKLTDDLSDDTSVWSSGNTFKETQAYSDDDLFASGSGTGTSCAKEDTVTANQAPAGPDGLGTQCTASLASGIDCHLRWYEIPVTLAGGKIYRLHVSTTDPNNASAQTGADGHNSFALWATATGGTPHVYGVGAMETFEPLPANQNSQFYLAQIGAQHAGKTMEIRLWDPGDTGALSASLKILAPTTTAYTATNFSWTSQQGTTNSGASSCNGKSGTNVSSVTTNTGNNSQFNGCWVIIDVAVPTNYTAPQPTGETNGGGWWKIEYDMGNQSTTPAFDLTTWQVSLLGNPVHLVVP
ncbi:MAG TPA: hypothetical protein VEI48_03205 [Candidatus Sulfotelmatobacter sp.]|nr:hypothetical protein [Candidatus Sulfotelmatobacter sp.]